MAISINEKKQIGGFALLFLFFSLVIGGSIYIAGSSGSDLRREKLALSSDSVQVEEKIEKKKDEEPSRHESPIAFPSSATLVDIILSFFRTFRPTTSQPSSDVIATVIEKIISTSVIRV